MINHSFIIIAYNEEKNISRTIASITRQDGLGNYEIIVVNDGSKDNTLAVVNKIAARNKHIKVVNLQPNRGRGAARAAGINAASGKYYALVDADIVLPKYWLTTCLSFMDKYEACGGTAVPDGDVSFVHRICGLSPKAVAHTTTVTGSNGLFKNSVFKKISFDPNKRNGEDVALGFQIAKYDIKTTTVPGLMVDHLETKTFLESLSWLYESGIGASRQFYEHPHIRLPDLAFMGFIVSSIGSLLLAALGVMPWWLAISTIIAFLLASSLMHLHGKFSLNKSVARSAYAVLINAGILLSYYLGRLSGLAIEWKGYGKE